MVVELAIGGGAMGRTCGGAEEGVATGPMWRGWLPHHRRGDGPLLWATIPFFSPAVSVPTGHTERTAAAGPLGPLMAWVSGTLPSPCCLPGSTRRSAEMTPSAPATFPLTWTCKAYPHFGPPAVAAIGGEQCESR